MAPEGDSGLSSPLSSPPLSATSSPLSSPGSTPSPPPEMGLLQSQFRTSYPSPPSSQLTSQTGSPVPDGMDSSTNSDKDGPPPTKRRRISKERTTEYLDLRDGEVDPEQHSELDRLLRVLNRHQKIVVIAGAGISVSAGSEFGKQYVTSVSSSTNDASQYLIFGHPVACSEVSKKNTNSKARASTYSTRLSTKMTRPLHPSTAWSAQCHVLPRTPSPLLSTTCSQPLPRKIDYYVYIRRTWTALIHL